MIFEVNDNVRIWSEFNPLAESLNRHTPEAPSNLFRVNREKVSIRGRWFDVLTPSELVRQRNEQDGYYRVIYLQVNMDTGEYYIGKANRPTWSQLQRYQGSGLKFRAKFSRNSDAYVRYYIAVCRTSAETEKLEASIVDQELLADDKCLNLVAGGAGRAPIRTKEELKEMRGEYMKSRPEQFRPMLEASKKAFQTGGSSALRARNERIKKTMGDEQYREMTRTRIQAWKSANPAEYAKARQKNRDSIRSPETQRKRAESLKKWANENPDEHRVWQEKLIAARTSESANKKRQASIKRWNQENPEQAKKNASKRARAAAAKMSKPVCMIDLESGAILQDFPSLHAAADWLVASKKAKNKNCVSSIGAVCSRKPCTTGYGHRKKAYGYDWRFLSDIKDKD